MSNAIKAQALVLHVTEGYEDRAKHIEKMLGDSHISFEYIFEGDMKELTPQVLDTYFADGGSVPMHAILPHTSCALKHIKAYEYIVTHHLKGALILEDDIIIHRRFITIFNATMDEIQSKGYHNVMISYEDSRLRFVPRSKRKAGQYLYPGDRDRMTGAYYIDNEGAQTILNFIAEHKCFEPIDHFHDKLLKEKIIQYLWCQPTIASQGSFNGMFKTSISTKEMKYENLRWYFKLFYKKFLYFIR